MLKKFLKRYINALKCEPKMLINYLLKEIIFYDDRVEITFNSPIKNSPNDKGCYFLSKLKQIKILTKGNTPIKIINMKIEIYIS